MEGGREGWMEVERDGGRKGGMEVGREVEREGWRVGNSIEMTFANVNSAKFLLIFG